MAENDSNNLFSTHRRGAENLYWFHHKIKWGLARPRFFPWYTILLRRNPNRWLKRWKDTIMSLPPIIWSWSLVIKCKFNYELILIIVKYYFLKGGIVFSGIDIWDNDRKELQSSMIFRSIVFLTYLLNRNPISANLLIKNFLPSLYKIYTLQSPINHFSRVFFQGYNVLYKAGEQV